MTVSTDPQSRPRLSVAMIVRNEEHVLAESIESVRSIADEIVVLDTGSTDQTVRAARQLGALTGQMAWCDDFSAARNRCLEEVTGDWILWLDAGERLDAESAEQLREFVDRQADPAKVYMLLVQVPSANPAASGEQVAQPRLIPRRPELRFSGRVRETLQASIDGAGLEVETAPGRIICHGRRHDPACKMLRAQRDLLLATLERNEHDGSPPSRVHQAMGDAYFDLGSPAEARKAFLAALESAEHGSSEALEAYYGLLTTYDGDEFLAQVQLTTCLEALETFPFDAQLLLAMGHYMQAKGRLDLAARSFDTAVQHGQIDLASWHLIELAEMAAVCLGLTLQAQGEDDQALRVLEESLQQSPNSDRLRRHTIDLHVKHGRCNEALKLAEHLPAKPQQREPLRNAIRGASRAAKEQWTAALAYLQGAYVAGCNDPLCLRWLAVTLLSNGQIEAAGPVLEQWQQVEPGNVELQTYLAALKQQDATATVAEEASVAPLPADSAKKHFRIDQGATTSQAGPSISPIVSQNSSAGWWQSARDVPQAP